MRYIVRGVIIIAIGFLFGGSVFLGDFTPINFLFDGVGTYFIIRGVLQLRDEKAAA